MKRRIAKHQSGRVRHALMRAHDTIHGHEYEIGLLRRANESLSRRAEYELTNARDKEHSMVMEIALLRRYLGDVERMVGKYSMAAGAPKSLRTDVSYRDTIEVPFFMPLNSLRIGSEEARETISRTHHLVMKKLNVRTVHEPMRRSTHLRAGLNDSEVCYFLSDEAIYDEPLEVIIPRLAEEMAERLIVELRSRKGNRPFGRFDDYEDRPRFRY